MYRLKMDIAQNDFQRYMTHSKFYDFAQLNVVIAIMKESFKQYLDVLNGIDEKILVRVLTNEDYDVYVTFDFVGKDVYFTTEYHGANDEHFTSNICEGAEIQNSVSLKQINQAYFSECVEKPTKVLIAMYYKDIVTFLKEEIDRLTGTSALVENVFNDYMKQQNSEQEQKTTQADEGVEIVDKTNETRPEPKDILPEEC